VAVIDFDSDHAVHWMSPNDADEDLVLGYGPESLTQHDRVVCVLFLDARVLTLPLESDKKDRHAMITIAGGEEIGELD
jgi:hypothetical protein